MRQGKQSLGPRNYLIRENKMKQNEATDFTVPTIYEDDEQGRRMGYDIFSRLLKDGIVTLNGGVSEQSAALIVAQLLWLDKNWTPAKGEMITLYINSPGGSVTAGMAIYDTMMRMKTPVRTVCNGLAASMGSFLLMAGYPGERYVLPNAEAMIHEVSAGTQGKATQMDTYSRLFNKTNNRLIEMYKFHTGLSEEVLRKHMVNTDTFMNAEEAVALGLVDHVAYESLAEKDDFKTAWAKANQDFNTAEAADRGKATRPVIDSNLMDDTANRKAPDFKKLANAGPKPK